MTEDPRLRIAASSAGGTEWAHLDALVAAEVSWGNRVKKYWYVVDPHFGDWELTFDKPFHVARLRETFILPPSIQLMTVEAQPNGLGARMFLSDNLNRLGISAPLSKDLPAVNAEIEL